MTPTGGLPCTVTVRLQVRLFPAASVAVYWTSVSPTGNPSPGLWLLVSVRRPPKKAMDIYLLNKYERCLEVKCIVIYV